MTYQETIDYLYGIRLFGQKLGLETMRQLLRLMDEPHRSLRFIHIAGTNGKGSVAAMLSSVLSAAGYKTGLYTSPHLVSFCERFQINGRPIAGEEVVRLVAEIRPLLETVAAHSEFRHPTFFEVVTAIALRHFQEQKVDVVVWETGLGGRLDATNVVTPLVSVITNIAFDHMQHLGDSLAKIAFEKCGIIKPGVPAVTAAQNAEALAVIRETCEKSGSRLTLVGEGIRARRMSETKNLQKIEIAGTNLDYGTLELPLLGQNQTVNCATAIAALEASGLKIAPADIRKGLPQTSWPGRFQIINQRPLVVLDGAHNAAAAESLVQALQEHFGGRRLGLILGVLRDKNFDQMCSVLAPVAKHIICVPVNSERTSDPAELAELCQRANAEAAVSTCPDLKVAYEAVRATDADVIVITGSLFLVGEALNRLGFPAHPTAACEKELVLQ